MARIKKPKPPLVYNTSSFKSFIINTLRRASYRWKPKSEALKEARRGEKGTPVFICNICKKFVYTGAKELSQIEVDLPKGTELVKGKVNVDHLETCVPLTGWSNYDDFIRRMFCPKEGFQILCEECHDEKTRQEKELRKEYRNDE